MDRIELPRPRRTTGLELRYALVVLLLDQGRPMRVDELVEHLTATGHHLRGRGGKAVSDALRWEVRRGRVRRLDRGLYGPGRMPRSTEWSIRHRLPELARRAA